MWYSVAINTLFNKIKYLLTQKKSNIFYFTLSILSLSLIWYVVSTYVYILTSVVQKNEVFLVWITHYIEKINYPVVTNKYIFKNLIQSELNGYWKGGQLEIKELNNQSIELVIYHLQFNNLINGLIHITDKSDIYLDKINIQSTQVLGEVSAKIIFNHFASKNIRLN